MWQIEASRLFEALDLNGDAALCPDEMRPLMLALKQRLQHNEQSSSLHDHDGCYDAELEAHIETIGAEIQQMDLTADADSAVSGAAGEAECIDTWRAECASSPLNTRGSRLDATEVQLQPAVHADTQDQLLAKVVSAACCTAMLSCA